MSSRIFLFLVLLLAPRLLLAQSESAPVAVSEELGARDSLLTTLPPQLRDEGRRVLATRDEDQRADLAEDLADLGVEETTEFLLGVLATDPSADVRSTIIEEIGDEPDARIVSALRRHLTSDPDPEVSLTALRMLNERHLADLGNLLEKRLDQARRSGGQEEIHLIALAQQQNLVRQAGANLPEFMQAPPPVFAVRPADQPIRALAFGDFGTGQEQQKAVAAAMLKYHEQHPFDLGLTLGDNFYSKGMQSPDDPRWKSWWHDMYDPLGIPFYAALGNHDWGYADSPASEILYSDRSTNWHMPATYYTYTAGPVQFFALETDVLSDAELMWLDRELAKSKARWKVAYAHHPIYSAGQHGNNEELIERLLPIIRGRLDVYLAGHDHDMQHLKPVGDLHFFVAGTGGKLREVEKGPQSLFAISSPGFAVLEASESRFTVRFVDPALRTLYEYTLTK